MGIFHRFKFKFIELFGFSSTHACLRVNERPERRARTAETYGNANQHRLRAGQRPEYSSELDRPTDYSRGADGRLGSRRQAAKGGKRGQVGVASLGGAIANKKSKRGQGRSRETKSGGTRLLQQHVAGRVKLTHGGPKSAHVPYWRVTNPAFYEFCFTVIGIGDIAGSRSNLTMNIRPL